MSRKLTIQRIMDFIKSSPSKEFTNERGNRVLWAWCDSERYVVDFAPDFQSEGWMQFDTGSDAHYFGVWVNPSKLLTLTYAEGDWSLVECPDAAHYNAEIQSACEFYDEGYIAKVISADGSMTTYRQDRSQFLIQIEERA